MASSVAKGMLAALIVFVALGWVYIVAHFITKFW